MYLRSPSNETVWTSKDSLLHQGLPLCVCAWVGMGVGGLCCRDPCLHLPEKAFSLLVPLYTCTLKTHSKPNQIPPQFLGQPSPSFLAPRLLEGKHKPMNPHSQLPAVCQQCLGAQETGNHSICSRLCCFSPGRNMEWSLYY